MEGKCQFEEQASRGVAHARRATATGSVGRRHGAASPAAEAAEAQPAAAGGEAAGALIPCLTCLPHQGAAGAPPPAPRAAWRAPRRCWVPQSTWLSCEGRQGAAGRLSRRRGHCRGCRHGQTAAGMASAAGGVAPDKCLPCMLLHLRYTMFPLGCTSAAHPLKSMICKPCAAATGHAAAGAAAAAAASSKWRG